MPVPAIWQHQLQQPPQPFVFKVDLGQNPALAVVLPLLEVPVQQLELSGGCMLAPCDDLCLSSLSSEFSEVYSDAYHDPGTLRAILAPKGVLRFTLNHNSDGRVGAEKGVHAPPLQAHPLPPHPCLPLFVML
jgi:hypothetical protein